MLGEGIVGMNRGGRGVGRSGCMATTLYWD